MVNIYNIVPCYLFSFSHEGLITRMNGVCLNQLGYSEEEVIGKKKFTDLLTVGSRIFYQTHFFPLIKLHGKFNEIFLSFLSKEKNELPVLLNVMMDGNEDVFEVHCGGIQIAQRNRFEKEILGAKNVAEKALLENEALVTLKQQLEQHQEVLEMRLRKISQNRNEHFQINTILSHDLQEPLRKISIFTNKLLTDENAGINKNSFETLEKINASAGKMRDLVVNIQNYLSLNEKRYLPTDINLESAFKVAIKDAGIDKNDPAIKLLFQSLPVIKADFSLMINLFYQLLSNSLKFRDTTKPTLHISVSCDYIEQNIFIELEHRYKYKEFLRINYTDNGIGFDNIYNEQIFVLFRKAHDINDGLGIGLSYCKKIVELHGGYISARSNKDEGSTFTILLPAFGE